jgi:hypothetical protein
VPKILLAPGSRITSLGANGSVCAIVGDAEGRGPYVLSCNHVFRAPGNAVLTGDEAQATTVGFVTQVAGIIVNKRVPDCAIALLDKANGTNSATAYATIVGVSPRVRKDDILAMKGATTFSASGQIVFARVLAEDVIGRVVHDGFGAVRTPGFILRPLPGQLSSQHGDSGAPWVLCGPDGRSGGLLAGMNVAGQMVNGSVKTANGKAVETEPTDILACHAADVFGNLRVSLWQGSPGAAPLVEGLAKSAFAQTTAVAMVVGTREDALLLRSRASDNADVLGRLPPGSLIHVLERNGEWAKVDLFGTGHVDGFVYAGYLREPAA